MSQTPPVLRIEDYIASLTEDEQNEVAVAEMAIDVARLLYRARSHRQLTQSEAAIRAHIQQQAVSRIEQPGANVQIATLHRYLSALGYSLEITIRDAETNAIIDRLQSSPAVDRFTEIVNIRSHGGPYPEAGLWGLIHRPGNIAIYLGERPDEGCIWRIDVPAQTGDDVAVETRDEQENIVATRQVGEGEIFAVFEAIASPEEDAYQTVANLILSGVHLRAEDEIRSGQLVRLIQAAANNTSWTFEIGEKKYILTEQGRAELRRAADALEGGTSESTCESDSRSSQPTLTDVERTTGSLSFLDAWSGALSEEAHDAWPYDRIQPPLLRMASV